MHTSRCNVGDVLGGVVRTGDEFIRFNISLSPTLQWAQPDVG